MPDLYCTRICKEWLQLQHGTSQLGMVLHVCYCTGTTAPVMVPNGIDCFLVSLVLLQA